MLYLCNRNPEGRNVALPCPEGIPKGREEMSEWVGGIPENIAYDNFMLLSQKFDLSLFSNKGRVCMKIIVSACLLGENCKYNGGNNKDERLLGLQEKHTVIPVCPEVLGGLPTPRKPAEIVNGTVSTADGLSVDDEFRKGAMAAFRIAKDEAVELAILQPRSPSCGCGKIYDGSFYGRLVSGNGVFAQMLIDNNIRVISPDDFKPKDGFLEKKNKKTYDTTD
jgi:uncharacterized protein YbbK (DUF523 family)